MTKFYGGTLRDYRSRFASALALADAWRSIGRLNAVKLTVWASQFTGALAVLLFLYLLLRLLKAGKYYANTLDDN